MCIRDRTYNGYILNIKLVEQKTLLPIVNFGFQESNKWGQLGLVDLNLFGTGDELLFYYQNNQGKHGGEVYYKKNRIFGQPINIKTSFLRWSSTEPVIFGATERFDYDFTLTQLGIGLEFLISNQISVSGGISGFTEAYNSYDSNAPGPESLNLTKGLVNLETNFSNIKYDGIYKENFSINLKAQKVATLGQDDIFYLLQTNLKFFKRIGKYSEFASQVNVGIASNSDSPFAPFVIDSYSNVRAAGDRVLRGTGIVSSNFEWREELYKKEKIIIQGVAFLDAVSLRLPGNEIQWGINNFNYFVSSGIGFRLHYTKFYNAVFRLDYGYEITRGDSQVIFGIGQYF